jgi:hypothetical protein
VSNSKTIHEWGRGVFLDPKNVGSSVQARVSATVWDNKTETNGRVDGSVRLTDCSRVIEWDFSASTNWSDGGDPTADMAESVRKLDEAIKLLTEMRAQYKTVCTKMLRAITTKVKK